MKEKATRVKPDFLNRFTGKFWVGGEARTWSSLGGLVGGTSGLILGVIILLFIWREAPSEQFTLAESAEVYNLNPTFVLFAIPLFGMFVGAAAGLLVGVGVPRYNPHPEQGHWESKKKLNQKLLAQELLEEETKRRNRNFFKEARSSLRPVKHFLRTVNAFQSAKEHQ